MKTTLAIAITALMCSSAWARNDVFTGNPGNDHFMGNPDNMDHILLNLGDASAASQGMGSTGMQAQAMQKSEGGEYYGTSKQESGSAGDRPGWTRRSVEPDLFGNVILDVHPELIPAYKDYPTR